MALVKDGEYMMDDYLLLSDESGLPDDPGQAVIVGLERWQREREALTRRAGLLGVTLQPDQSPDHIAGDLACFATVVVNFPTFSDGRGFSHARRLRENHGYQGDIRASGHIIRDQYLFLHRCGVNVIDVPDQAATEQWKIAMAEFSTFYQNTIDSRNPLMRMRQTAGPTTRSTDNQTVRDGS